MDIIFEYVYLRIGRYKHAFCYWIRVTHKEVVQNQLDLLNSVLSSTVIGGMLGMVLLSYQTSISNLDALFAVAFFLIFELFLLFVRNKLLVELESMN